MFFVNKDFKKDIIIPRTFFEKIIPLSPPIMVKVYLYSYFLSVEEMDESFTNKDLSERLNITEDEVKETWDFYEACGIIKKHSIEGSSDYYVEFLDFNKASSKKNGKKELGIQELLLFSQNQEHKKMLEQIEDTIGTYLVPEEIRRIESFINEYNIPKVLMVEAFNFCVEKKKSRTAKMAIGVARTWYLEGIRTVEDLDVYNQRRGNRYGEYKKILAFLGEYRTATKAEEELIDKWLDEYKFSIEVIEEACRKSLSIKSPNLKYIDGILKNWDIESEQLQIKGSLYVPKKDPTMFRLNILEALDHKGRSLSQEELEFMKALYECFSLEDALLGVKELVSTNRDKTIENLYALLQAPCCSQDNKTKVAKSNENRLGIEAMDKVINKRNKEPKSKRKTDEASQKRNEEMEKLVLEKQKKWKEEVLDGQKD